MTSYLVMWRRNNIVLTSFCYTVKIRTSTLGAYLIFEFFTWAPIQSGRLLSARRLIIFNNLLLRVIIFAKRRYWDVV